MIIYDGVKSDFMRSVEDGCIANVIEKNILSRMGRHTTANEFSAFDNSLQRMYTVLNDEGIPSDAGIAIEYNIPQTAKRVDFMISGFDSDEKPSVVIVELKQWQKMEKVELPKKKKEKKIKVVSNKKDSNKKLLSDLEKLF